MIGIYYWKNLKTNQMYIGQSINIFRRKDAHERAYYNTRYQNKLYQSMRQDGLENFEFGILEECLPEELNEKEKYYIQLYHTYPDQLNMTMGGTTVQGSNNPNTLLTNEDVLTIRNRIYLGHEDLWAVYLDYEDKIGESRFWSLVHGDSWKSVDTSMIYSLKDRGYHNFDGSKNPQAKLQEQDVRDIRIRHMNGEENQEIYKDYQDRISYSAFYKIICGNTWKDILPESFQIKVKIQRQGQAKAKLSLEDVKKIRKLYSQGQSQREICQIYSYVTPNTIRRIINNETWKNI